MTPVLEARGLVRHFTARRAGFGRGPTIRAVDGVDLAILKGETFAVVGESGCGKSTLARLLLGLIAPTAGEVLHEGRSLARLAPAELRGLRARLQIVFQDPYGSLNPQLTVGTLIGEPLAVHRGLRGAALRARVGALLDRVGLPPEHARRYPHEFSGGQRQRIGIARALAAGPEILVADEPVSALDVSVQAQIVNLLGDLRDAFGLTLVLIAHDLGVIRHMSDRMAVMYLGRIVETGPAGAVFARPQHPYTRALIRAIPALDPARRDRPEPLGGDIPSPASPPSGCRFHPRCPAADALCARDTPRLEASGEGRHVACHHWRRLGVGETAPEGRHFTAAAEQRLALWRSRVGDTAPTTTEEAQT